MGRIQQVSTGGFRGESLDLFSKAIFVGCQLTAVWLHSCVPETPYTQNAGDDPGCCSDALPG